ncbi:Vacuolar amino acid transporter 2 [Diplonema papillatum]|nr:Vacuolar amino acid transporter 2 [Diplonema papillatum]
MQSADASVPRGASTASALFNMINAILGAGIVGLAYAWAQSGFVLGWVLFVFVTIVTCYTMELVITIADTLCRKGDIDVVSYDELVERVLGVKGRWFILVSQFLFAFGIAIGYVVIMRDDLPTGMQQLTDSSVFEHKTLVMIVVAAAFLLPMSLLRSVAALTKASFLCFLSSLAIIAIVAYERATQRDALCAGPTELETCAYDWDSLGRSSVFSVYGIFIFTKTCHHTEFQIYRSLGASATPARWKWILRSSMVICSIITSSCSMIVYSIFGQGVESDFFKSFWKSSHLVSVGRLMFTCVILMSYPMQIFVARETIQILILEYYARNSPDKNAEADAESRLIGGDASKKQVMQYDGPCYEVNAAKEETPAADPEQQGSPDFPEKAVRTSSLNRRDSKMMPPAAGGAVREDTPAWLHYSTTLVLFFTTVTIGCIAGSLGTVLNLVGGVAGGCIGYILPGLIGFYCEAATGVPAPGGRYLAFATVVLGVFTVLASTISNFV